MSIPRTVAFVCVALALTGAAVSSASAQTLTVNGAASATVKSGQDFAATGIGDPWDFSNPDDLSWMFSSGWTRPSSGVPLAGGTFTGTATTNPSLQIQFEGVDGALNLVGRNGVRFPIDSSVYKRVAFRMRRNRAPHIFDLLEATWLQGTTRTLSNTGGRYALSNGYDGDLKRYVNQSPLANHDDTSYHIYKFDVDGAHPQNRGYQTLWGDAAVRGLSLRLADGPAVTPGTMNGATIDVDWVRLTRRGMETAALAWTGFAPNSTVTLTATNGTDTIQIFPDNDTSGTTFTSSALGAGSFTWDYGFLSPGTWTITATPSAGSARTATLVISAAPIIRLTEPDETGGRDFARTVIGDALDMTNSQDITRYGLLNNITGATYTNSGLTATTAANGPIGAPNIEDPAVYLLTDDLRQNTYPPAIDAGRYRHLTFTMQYDHPELTSAEALGPTWGGVARVGWRRKTVPGEGGALTVTQDIFVADGGPRTYSMDLATFTEACEQFTCQLEPAAVIQIWAGEIGTFRIDPYESQAARQFTLSNVKIAADDEPNGNGFFAIRWNATDASFTSASLVADPAVADGATVNLFYDTDTNPASGLTVIASNVPAASGQYAWNVANIAVGRYYIYAVITDTAGNTQARYSTGVVRIGSVFPAATDTDLDGMSDTFESRFAVSSATVDEDGDGVSNLAEYQNGTDPRVSNSWSLPEGATNFFLERIAVANPGTDPADFTLTFLRESGSPIVRDYSVPAQGRITVVVNQVTDLADAAVSTVSNTTSGGVVVERTMMWDARDSSFYGGHTGKALQNAGTQWFLAEGEASFFQTYIQLANANSAPATVNVSYLVESGAPIPAAYTVPANARLTIFTNAVPGLAGKSFSTSLSSNIPITVERAMYFGRYGPTNNIFNGGHGAAAVAAAATSWLIAEGRTGPFFDMYLLLANPGTVATTAQIRYLKPGGIVVTESRTLPPTSRTTIHVDSVAGLADTDVSASITTDQPIVVERAMYWPDPFTNWYEAHASAGVTATGTEWALAEGEVGGSLGFETYILFANPGSASAAVTMTFLRSGGASPITATFTVAANSRLTRSAGEFGLTSGEKFGVLVQSLQPIAVERAMYWNGGGQFWGGGTNETAVKLR